MPITYEEAFAATNPDKAAYPGLTADSSDDDLQKRRDQAARNLMAGVAANDAYWNSRSELEALKAKAAGHGTVVNGDHPDGIDTAAVSGSDSATIEGTATEEDTARIEAATGRTEETPEPGVTDATVVPSPDNPNEAIAKLREQLRNAGQEPVA